MSFFDNFSQVQLGNSTVSNTLNTWGPGGTTSTRQLSSTSGSGPDITQGTPEQPGFFALCSPGLTNTVLYSYPSPQDLTFLQSISFINSKGGSTGVTQNTNVVVTANGSTVIGSHSQILPTNGTSTTFTVPLTPPPGRFLVTSMALAISNFSASSIVNGYTLGHFTSTSLCLVRGSLVATLEGPKPIEDLCRGDWIEGGRVAQIIREEISPQQQIELIEFSPSSLGPDLPKEKTLACSEHYFVFQGKRRLAKSFLAFPGVRYHRNLASLLLPGDEEKRYFIYDIQFDFEGSYVVNGLTSQSRSPYALASPLPKELYFQAENYREERVLNTLTDFPPITFNYLLPNGEEVESFAQIKEK